MAELTINESERCQVRSGTTHPCDRPAAVRLQGVPFCELCAREQEVYFAIGGLTEAAEEAGAEGFAVAVRLMKKIRSRHQMGQNPEPHAA